MRGLSCNFRKGRFNEETTSAGRSGRTFLRPRGVRPGGGRLGRRRCDRPVGHDLSPGPESWDWDKSWWQTSTGRLTGYWDAGYTYWEGGDEGAGKHSLSFAPVFVYEFAGDSIKPFIEAGIGVAAFSGTRVGDQNLGSSLNFEDRIGAGLKFANGQSVGVRAIHYSNAGLKQPNDGIESYSLFYKIPI